MNGESWLDVAQVSDAPPNVQLWLGGRLEQLEIV